MKIINKYYKGPSYDQRCAIRLGVIRGVDIKKYNNINFHYRQMCEIRMALEAGVDMQVSPFISYEILRDMRIAFEQEILIKGYIDKGYNSMQLEELLRALKLGLDVSQYDKKEVTWEQMGIAREKDEKAIGISKYSTSHFNWKQRREICLGLIDGLDVTKYNDKNLNHYQMEQIRLGLKANIDVTEYNDGDKFNSYQMEQIRLGLIRGLDVSKYNDSNLPWFFMDETRVKLLKLQH